MVELTHVRSLLDFDKSSMSGVLKDFPNQVRRALAIGAEAPVFSDASPFSLLAFAGMGGSAVAGDLLRCVFQGYGADAFALIVSRSYRLPTGINANAAVIASSYSGNTEETLAAYTVAKEKTRRLLCIAAGGELKRRADADGVPVIVIPDGLQPRCAVGYSFFPLLSSLCRRAEIPAPVASALMRDAEAVPALLEKLEKEFSNPALGEQNRALHLAAQLIHFIPVVYSSPLLEAVNLRWRGQIQENGKHIAFGGVLPEMNHNEINGWLLPEDLAKRCAAVFLRDGAAFAHPRMEKRFEATKRILLDRVGKIMEIVGDGNSLLEQMFSLVYLADWTSYWLALLARQDPTEINDILALKSVMSS
jgi:glucose/mannose-6-phosphate isomerase